MGMRSGSCRCALRRGVTAAAACKRHDAAREQRGTARAHGVVPTAYPLSGPSVYRTPVDHVAGNDASVVCRLVSAAPPVTASRNLTVPRPDGLRIAIQ